MIEWGIDVNIKISANTAAGMKRKTRRRWETTRRNEANIALLQEEIDEEEWELERTKDKENVADMLVRPLDGSAK